MRKLSGPGGTEGHGFAWGSSVNGYEALVVLRSTSAEALAALVVINGAIIDTQNAQP